MKKMLIQLWSALLSLLSGRFSISVIRDKFLQILWQKFGVRHAAERPAIEKHNPKPQATVSRASEKRAVAAHELSSAPEMQEHETKGITPSRIRKIVDERWQLRYNELDNNIELREREGSADFLPMTDRLHNTLVMNVQEELPQCYRSWVDCYLYSEAVPSYHPLRQYLKDLPQWDGTDRVGRVASMVSDDPQWHFVFRRWLRAMVAGWMQAEGGRTAFVNHLAPVLISSRQGLGKSTFCRSLLPPSLRAYYTDKLSLIHI